MVMSLHKTMFFFKVYHANLVLLINGYYYPRPGKIWPPMTIRRNQVHKTSVVHLKLQARIFTYVQKKKY